MNIGVGPDGTVALPTATGRSCHSAFTRLVALPFALSLFLAIDQLPLAAEVSDRFPKRDMPKGVMLGCSP